MSQSPDQFRALLTALHPDAQMAADEYRRLHERTARLFALNSVSDPQALADEAMDRLARRVAEKVNDIASPASFLQGIARHLLLEDARRRKRERETATEWIAQRTVPPEVDEEIMQSVEECLARIEPEQQKLLRNYYRESGGQKSRHHSQMAKERGISLNALRNQLMRARRKLDKCVRQKLRDVSEKGDT